MYSKTILIHSFAHWISFFCSKSPRRNFKIAGSMRAFHHRTPFVYAGSFETLITTTTTKNSAMLCVCDEFTKCDIYMGFVLLPVVVYFFFSRESRVDAAWIGYNPFCGFVSAVAQSFCAKWSLIYEYVQKSISNKWLFYKVFSDRHLSFIYCVQPK